MPETDEPCIHDLWPASSCVTCRETRDRAELQRQIALANKVSGDKLFPAQYRLFCKGCEDWFAEGAMIGRMANGEYRCASCWLEAFLEGDE